ncbi:hypothetical protein A943_11790 [Bacillus sp. CPSM8]|nr:hypothetical protein A943_11790 [Bacillus sp. CPSM8]BCE05832.1 hypothetical protein RSC1_01989 [Bacillus paralicheniformis]BCE12054.1 hypothetical protein RSC2_03850 [Bacillus paralicheniformis]BCE13675.1 hypothetical protein RSC3_01031 [Bacillus paralicheniformis]VEB18185.1 Uncharacterised protein [Bacillus paralicheniformis]
MFRNIKASVQQQKHLNVTFLYLPYDQGSVSL